jgi:two-component system sensor histidine kinase PhoQ
MLFTDSLHSRLFIAATVVLAGFLGTTGIALYKAFKDSAETALRERLLGQIYALIAATDEDRQGRMLLPVKLPDQRFSNLESGLYALVVEDTGKVHWRTPSLVGQTGNFLQLQPPGKIGWNYWNSKDRSLLVVNFGIAWEDYHGKTTSYTFAVATDIAIVLQEIQAFRLTLWTLLGGLAIILLIIQGIILRWGLNPLRIVAADLQRIETGLTEHLDGVYPRELRILTNNINTLINNARAKQQRYRNSLDDLAHSLKTPLAIIRNITSDAQNIDNYQELVQEQIQRMDNIVQHQLRRAATVGKNTFGVSIPIAPVIERLVRSLNKVYKTKNMHVNLNLASEARFFGDEADLMEIMGNIIDNAFKYGRCKINISSSVLLNNNNVANNSILQVEDDGLGVNPTRINELMQRGLRLDETVPGQGIGLAVARDIIALYGGRIEITNSDSLGGACVIIYLMQ